MNPPAPARPQPGASPGLFDPPPRLFAATPSRLASWLDCPRRYRMTYLDRPPPGKGPPWAHNSFGATVHTALAAWWRLPLERRSSVAAGALVERGWLTDGYRDEEQQARARVLARRLVESYVAELDPTVEPLGVERTVGARTRVLALSGRVDRLDERGQEIVVVDYKTGRRPLTSDDARGSLALALYALAVRRMFRRGCRRVELHHLPTGRVLGWDHGPESLERHQRRAEAIAVEAARAEHEWGVEGGPPGRADEKPFPPRPGPQCTWCDYARHCPEGRAVAGRLEPWAGLPDEVAG